MKRIFKNLIIAQLMLAGAFASNAQAQVDLQVGATLDQQGGIYLGANYTGSLDVTFNHLGFTPLPPNSFRIQLSLPTCAEFNASYVAPAGWLYEKLGPQDARLTPSATVGVLFAAIFNVPFTTLFQATPPAFTAAQLINLAPGVYTDPNGLNNVSTTTIIVGGSPLPVQFASFEAKANGCDVNLNWITSNEKENASFNIERSANGTKFETIESVISKGNGTNAKRYNFVDANPLSGKSFYRVSQVDIDGKSTSTKVESVTINCMVSTIEIYPNPATDFINVKGMQTGKNTVRIINVAGQVVAEEVSEVGQQQVNIAKLASGSYQVQVSQNDQVVFTGKFVKAK